MFHRASLRFSVVMASIFLLASCFSLRAQDDNEHHGRKYKAPPPSSRIEVTVVRSYNGKPIPGAHVIFHPIQGDKDTGSLELKTDDDGKAIIEVIPIGDTVTLQVIANGFQTYGQVFKIDKPNMSMDVRMNRPTPQYSVYKNNQAGSGDKPGSDKDAGSGNNSGTSPDNGTGKNSDSGKSPNPPQDSAPPAPGDKPSGSTQSDPPPSGNQSQPPK